jgi:tetratricopeptide (TPR) repeat protein
MPARPFGLEAVMPAVLATLLLAATPAAVQAPSAAPAITAGAEVAAGDAAARKLDLAGAIVAYRAAVKRDADDAEAQWKLARSLADKATLSTDPNEQEKLCVEAERYARRAVKLAPNSAKTHDYLAIALGKLALFEGGKRKVELSKEVKAEADRALQLDPNDDLALHVLAIWNREVYELNWFLRQFAQILYGKLPKASLDAAITDLTRATELRPDVIPHHVELGVTLADARRWGEAKAELEKGLTLPTGWVTDDHYRALARETLARVEAHLR